MALEAGARLGAYEIRSPLGEGGMGEVYRARDPKLNRDVAIKILPPSFSSDPDRVARFQREAQLLAALNHPHIAAIHGLEEVDGAQFLVLELVDGATLAERIASGALALDEALAIARQIADALEAAHEKGIIHRDLKPANIALTPDGHVKVLDFGLAKAIEPDGGTDPSHSPTLTFRATQAGMILGTAAYMSPEQARGRPADKRTDVWAFGCVLYEMLTGKRAFEGEDVTDTIAAVVRGEPNWSALPKDLPAQTELLIRRCLVKDRKQRISDIGVARFLMSETIALPAAVPPAAVATPPPRSRLRTIAGITTAVALGGVLTAAALWTIPRLRPPAAPQPARFTVVPPPAQPLTVIAPDRNLAISPAGTHIVYHAAQQLAVRAIDQLEPQPLTATNNGRAPFFSPDGRWIGFVVATELKKVSITGGPAITLCRFSGPPRGASWGDDDSVIFATAEPTTGLWRVASGGGEPKAISKPEAGLDHIHPHVLPGSKAVLFTISSGQLDTAQVAVLDVATGQTRTLVRGGSQPEYVAPGYLVYAAGGSLRAVRFDLERLQVTSDPVPVVEQALTSAAGSANFSVSRTGILVYIGGSGRGPIGAERSLVWVTRQGKEEPVKAPLRAYTIVRLSPDATRVALDVRDQEADIWVWDFRRETLTRLTFDSAPDSYPVWTPDGQRIIFTSARGGGPNVYRQLADGTGTAERLASSSSLQSVTSITPDSSRIVFHDNVNGGDIGVITLTAPGGSAPPPPASQATTSSAAATGRTEPLLASPFAEMSAELSRDGRWLAYASAESGEPEIYVRPFPNVNGGRWQISTGGGTKPVWAHNGRELFYFNARNQLMAVAVQATGTTFVASNPTRLLDGSFYMAGPQHHSYDVSPDGQRFLMIKASAANEQSQNSSPFLPSGATPAESLVVVLNWIEELKQRAGAAR